MFEEKFADVIEPALRAEYPDVMGEECGEKGRREVDVFRRKWICKSHLLVYSRSG